MIRMKELLLEKQVSGDMDDPLHGKTKANASNWVHTKVDKLLKGFFTDEYWKPIQAMFKELDRLRVNWVSTGARYHEERVTLSDGSSAVVPVRKTWTFEIKFQNNRDKQVVLYGHLTAHGAGMPASPLDRYDLALTVS